MNPLLENINRPRPVATPKPPKPKMPKDPEPPHDDIEG